MHRAWLVAVAIVVPAIALGQQAIRAPAGMIETFATETVPDTFRLPINPVGTSEAVTEPRVGAVERYAFRGERPSSALGAVDAIAGPLAAAGFRTLLDCAEDGCGGFDFMLSIDVLRQPAMMVNPLDFHQRTLSGTTSTDRAVSISILASRFAGRTHLQVVRITELPPERAATPVRRPTTQASVVAAPVEGEQMAESPAEVRDLGDDPVATLAATLKATGRVILHGIDFESASAEKGLTVAPVLDHVAALLRAQPALEVVVVGHSDGVGGLPGNITLSRARAAAVVAALETRGVERGRLEAVGAGWVAPIAPNTTEQGRAANRRVELVLR